MNTVYEKPAARHAGELRHSASVRAARHICIVTPGYISSTPRVVKEADALCSAGYRVRVVFSQGDLSWVLENDRRLLDEKPWSWSAVHWDRTRADHARLYWRSRARHNFFQRLPAAVARWSDWAARGEGRVYPELAAAAQAQRADLFIGHYPSGLAAAARAASKWQVPLGYDAEDLHVEEQDRSVSGRKKTERIRAIESRWLPRCQHVTAVSPLIADELAGRYGIHRPPVVYNVFPWAERSTLDASCRDRQGSEPSLYWYSQTIGDNRGIEDVIRASGSMSTRVQIHLRGLSTEQTRARLMNLARRHGIGDSLYFHDPVSTSELLSRAAEHDIGLALEQPVNLSRRLSVTNKLFFYLLAGLAIAASDVPGQRQILAECPDAGFLYVPGDVSSLAQLLDQLVADPARLASCKRASLAAAQRRWNWELESRSVVARVDQLLGQNSRSRPPSPENSAWHSGFVTASKNADFELANDD